MPKDTENRPPKQGMRIAILGTGEEREALLNALEAVDKGHPHRRSAKCFSAIVWPGPDEVPGQRLSVWADNVDEARRIVRKQHPHAVKIWVSAPPRQGKPT
jgi:hypothetical protein